MTDAVGSRQVVKLWKANPCPIIFVFLFCIQKKIAIRRSSMKMVSGKQQRLEKAHKKFGRNQQILGSLRAGWSARKIATEYSISYSWAKKLCKRLKNGGKEVWFRQTTKDNNP